MKHPLDMVIELVVARYNENLNWLRKVPKDIEITVYDKGDDGAVSAATPLPNLGREAHSYLHHIVNNYDQLADVTIFAQGRPFDHAFDFHSTLREIAGDPDSVNGFRWLGHIIDTDDVRGERLFKAWSKNDEGASLDMRGFHNAVFGDDGPPLYTFVLGAQFAVERKIIHSRTLGFWKNALEVAITFPDAAHCYERSWDHVFGVEGIDREWLAGRETVYLKPIRRLSGDAASITIP